MPISHIHMREGKSEEYRQSIFDSFYEALRAVLPIPEDDQFMTITEHSSVNFRYGNAFGVERTDDVIYIRLTIFDGRTVEVKQQLVSTIVEKISLATGMRPEDIFINLTESPRENWSVGSGELQFVTG